VTSYVLDNAHQAAEIRLRILERLYDPATRANLLPADVSPGRDLWEVGAGAGSVAAWAARQGASVTITDVDLRHLSDDARRLAMSVLTHDVQIDEPPGSFDVIHLRLVASHLPAWRGTLPRLLSALRPGGWLVVEELDPMLDYAPAGTGPGDYLINRVGKAFGAALASRGGDPTLGRRLFGQFTAAGLGRISATGLIATQPGGGLIAELMRVNTEQTAPILHAYGITPGDLDAYWAALRDPGQQIAMPVLWAVRGQVPA
jgi:SAM-dependent methyltransferase